MELNYHLIGLGVVTLVILGVYFGLLYYRKSKTADGPGPTPGPTPGPRTKSLGWIKSLVYKPITVCGRGYGKCPETKTSCSLVCESGNCPPPSCLSCA